MDFAFCWEMAGCSEPCEIRDRKILFCWRARSVNFQSPRYCDSCEYRLRWVRGEYSVQAFIRKYNRRESPRDEKKVLVIDDDPNILFALEDSVRSNGYDCVSACDGEDGLVLARGILPDLIITDVIMPKMDGFELCLRLRAHPETAHIPVIIVTARDRKADADRGRTIGAEAFLVKPFRSSELSGHIGRVLQPQ